MVQAVYQTLFHGVLILQAIRSCMEIRVWFTRLGIMQPIGVIPTKAHTYIQQLNKIQNTIQLYIHNISTTEMYQAEHRTVQRTSKRGIAEYRNPINTYVIQISLLGTQQNYRLFSLTFQREMKFPQLISSCSNTVAMQSMDLFRNDIKT